jgi:putative ABC transport system permease protein
MTSTLMTVAPHDGADGADDGAVSDAGRTPSRSRLRLLDALSVGTVGLRVRRGRTALTAIGIAIGIAAMVAVVGISASSRADLLARLDRLGTNLLQVTPGQSFLGDSAKLPVESTSMIRRIAPVESSAATATVDATVRRNDRISASQTGGMAVQAADPTLAETLGAHVREGAFLDDATGKYPTVVLGAKAAALLGITDLGAHPAVWLGDQWFTVIGILDPIELVPDLDRSVFVGFGVAEARLGLDGSPSTVFVRTVPDKLDQVRNVLAATASPEHPNEVKVTRPSDAIEARTATDQGLTALLVGLGGVALIVGGVGIANVMVISVLERRNEIGVRRALGAARIHVLVQFVIEAVLLAGLGGVVGVLVGAGVTAFYATRQGWVVAVPAAALAAGIGLALVVGAVAGLYPASRAARLAPADAVRA